MQIDQLASTILNDLYATPTEPLLEKDRERILIWLHFQAMHSLARSAPRARFQPARRRFAAGVLAQSA